MIALGISYLVKLYSIECILILASTAWGEKGWRLFIRLFAYLHNIIILAQISIVRACYAQVQGQLLQGVPDGDHHSYSEGLEIHDEYIYILTTAVTWYGSP